MLTSLTIAKHAPACRTAARLTRINTPDEDPPPAPSDVVMQCVVHECTSLTLAVTLARTVMISANFASATPFAWLCPAHQSISVSGSR
jgi:hypothetical protein